MIAPPQVGNEELLPQESQGWIQIEGEIVEVELDEGEHGAVLHATDVDWLVFQSPAEAGLRAREAMAEIARNDPVEFAGLIGFTPAVAYRLEMKTAFPS